MRVPGGLCSAGQLAAGGSEPLCASGCQQFTEGPSLPLACPSETGSRGGPGRGWVGARTAPVLQGRWRRHCVSSLFAVPKLRAFSCWAVAVGLFGGPCFPAPSREPGCRSLPVAGAGGLVCQGRQGDGSSGLRGPQTVPSSGCYLGAAAFPCPRAWLKQFVLNSCTFCCYFLSPSQQLQH